MIYWDTSALVPLLVQEGATPDAIALLAGDQDVLAWWGTPSEIASAIARREREGALSAHVADGMRLRLETLTAAWIEVAPGEEVRGHARRLLLRHPLRAADALQLGAALTAVRGEPTPDVPFACFDRRLATAARAEGFRLAFGVG